MKTYSNATLHITPISPVHIGTSQDFEPTNYVMDEGILFHYETDALIAVLSEDDKGKLAAIVTGKTEAARLIPLIRGFFYDQRDKLIAFATHALPVSSGVHELYAQRVKSLANKESGGQDVINKLAIERTFYNPFDQKPIIPGSSIKGAIRTAILDHLNNGKPTNLRNKELQEQLLKGKFQTDPLRLISLADTICNPENQFSTEVLFAVDRKKKKTIKDGNVVRSMAEDNGLYQLLETISPFQHRAFKSSLTIQQLQGINVAGKTPDKALSWSITELAGICNRFYRKRFEEEIKILKERSYLNQEWQTLADDCLAGEIAERLNTNSAFLLRVGRHSGAESVTLDGVRSIKILEGKGNSSKKPNSTTLWLAAENEKDSADLLPFGWLLVEVAEAGGQIAPLKKLSEFSQKFENTNKSRQQKLSDVILRKRQEVESYLHEQRRLQQKKEDELRRQEEEKKREEEEKKRLEGLPRTATHRRFPHFIHQG